MDAFEATQPFFSDRLSNKKIVLVRKSDSKSLTDVKPNRILESPSPEPSIEETQVQCLSFPPALECPQLIKSPPQSPPLDGLSPVESPLLKRSNSEDGLVDVFHDTMNGIRNNQISVMRSADEGSQQLLWLDDEVMAREVPTRRKGVHRRRQLGKLTTASSDSGEDGAVSPPSGIPIRSSDGRRGTEEEDSNQSHYQSTDVSNPATNTIPPPIPSSSTSPPVVPFSTDRPPLYADMTENTSTHRGSLSVPQSDTSPPTSSGLGSPFEEPSAPAAERTRRSRPAPVPSPETISHSLQTSMINQPPENSNQIDHSNFTSDEFLKPTMQRSTHLSSALELALTRWNGRKDQTRNVKPSLGISGQKEDEKSQNSACTPGGSNDSLIRLISISSS